MLLINNWTISAARRTTPKINKTIRRINKIYWRRQCRNETNNRYWRKSKINKMTNERGPDYGEMRCFYTFVTRKLNVCFVKLNLFKQWFIES